MLDMDQVTSIRHAVLVLGRSRRWASRNFQVARETVDRYLEGAEPGKRKASPRASPKRAMAAAALATVVAETAVAKKQQLTVQRAHELVRAKGLDVGYTLIKQLVREERRAAKEVYVPLVYRSAERSKVWRRLRPKPEAREHRGSGADEDAVRSRRFGLSRWVAGTKAISSSIRFD